MQEGQQQPVWLSNIKAIGFDVDGTLYHAPNALERFFRRELKEKIFTKLAKKMRITEKEAEERYWVKKQALGSNTATMNSFGFDGEKFFQRLFDVFPLEKYVKRDKKLITMMTGLRKKGYRLFIISNGRGDQVRRKLALLGIEEEWFERVVYCYDYGWVKPEQAPFEKVMREMGLKGEECFYVGDRCETDGVGAKEAGMRVGIIGRDCRVADVKLPDVYEVGEMFGVR